MTEHIYSSGKVGFESYLEYQGCNTEQDLEYQGCNTEQVTSSSTLKSHDVWTCLVEGVAWRGGGGEHTHQRVTIATMNQSTSTLAQRQELRRLLAQYPTLLSREGPGDEYLVTRKNEMSHANSSKQPTTRTQKQKLQSEW